MGGYTLLQMLTGVIRLLADYPQGLSILAGSVQPPDTEELYSLWKAVKAPPVAIEGGFRQRRLYKKTDIELEGAETINRIIRHSGGWRHIYRAVQNWQTEFKGTWEAVSLLIVHKTSVLDSVNYDRIAQKCHVSRRTISRIIDRFPRDLAAAILNTPIEAAGSYPNKQIRA